jgi:pimeloyl-ACP methyl ester carboxylesterase
MKITYFIFAVFAFFAASYNAAVFANEECSDFISKLPTDFFYGYVSVPEDWNNINGRHINVFYYGRKNTGESVAFFNGGPSSSSHGSYGIIEQHSESKILNFVYIDQRGTGCSDPYPNDLNLDTASRLAHYTSRSIVRDSEVIRKTLLGPNKKWKIFGQSYGGMIVHRYLEMAPESIISAHVHGYAIMSDQVEWMKLRILSQKRVLEDYFRLYPQDKNDLANVKAMIKNDQCFTEEGVSICGPILMDTLRHPLGFHNTWEYMHWWIENLAIYIKEQPSMLLGLSAMYFSDFTHDSLPNLIINKVEISKGPSDRDECNEAFSRLKKDGDNPDLWAINECRVLINIQNEKFDSLLDSVKNIDPLTIDAVKKSLRANPNLKLFLYAGQQDVFVPVETFTEEAQNLNSLITFQIFPDSGHEGFHTEQAVWDDLIK